MPEWCIDTRCIDCESHAVVSGKLDCNYLNRLGLAQPTVKTFLDAVPTPESLEEKIEAEKKRMDETRKEIDRLKGLKEKYGGEKKDANVS